MTKVYVLQTLCVQKNLSGCVVNQFIENSMVFKTDVGIVVAAEFSNDLEIFKTMKDFKMSFVHKLRDFNKWCELTYLGEL